LSFRQASRDQDAGRIVAVQFLPHPHHRNAKR
jgi:hypothetical protein